MNTFIFKVKFEQLNSVLKVHTYCFVEAKDVYHAKERALQVLRKNPSNKNDKYKFLSIEVSSIEECPDYIRIDDPLLSSRVIF